MENIFLILIYKKIVNFIRKIKNKIKDKFLFVLGAVLFVMFCFFITNVKAVDTVNYNFSGIEYSVIPHDEGKGYIVICDSNGIPWRNYFVGQGGYAYTFTYNSSNNTISQIGNTNFYCNFQKNTDGFYNSVYAGSHGGNISIPSGGFILYSNKDIKNSDGSVYLKANTLNTQYLRPPFVAPSIKNTDEDLLNRSTEVVIINAGSVSQYDDKINFSVSRLDKQYFDDDVFLYESVELFSTDLNWTSLYYKSLLDSNNVVTEFNYQIPYSDMKIVFEEGKTYQYCLSYFDSSGAHQNVVRNIVIGSLSETEKLKNDINIAISDFSNQIIESNNKTQEIIKEQTNAIEENNKTNKNIFESIVEVLSYINPFSENFFVYKLIDLLIEALKALFIPRDTFFNDWLADMNDYFSDRFGLLYYPIDLVIDFLTRVVSVSNSLGSSCVLTIPDLKIMDVTLIRSFTFDFNTIVQNEAFRNVYNIYLIVVDVILSLLLVAFARNTFVDIFGGQYIDGAVHDIYDAYEESKIKQEQTRKSNYIGFRK